MNTRELVLRCYGKKQSGQFVVVCLDFNLAAQGDTFDEAWQKLQQQIHEHLDDALAGEDKAHVEQMLNRRAPLSLHLDYYSVCVKIKLATMLNAALNNNYVIKPSVLPMQLQKAC